VFLNLSSREEIERAFPIASGEGRREQTVVVEQFVPGVEHRLLVVGGRMVACAKGEHIYVTGDGRRTIAELIDLQINSDPRRGRSAAMPNKTVDLDATVLAQLAQEGVTPETVPADGRRVLVKQIGTHGLDVTASVHPEMAAIAVRAARAIGLDIAGIDLIARDIDRPPREQGAAVCEVNAGPQLMIHANPSRGPGQPVGEAIAAELFNAGETGRIPIAAFMGRQASAAAMFLDRWLRAAGRTPGLTCSDGKWVAGWQCSAEPHTTADAARDLLVSPEIDAAVVELDWQSLAARGFPFDRCDVLVLDRLPATETSSAAAAAGVTPLAVVETLIDTVAAAGTIVLVDADAATADLVARRGRTVITIEPPGAPATVAAAVATALGIPPDAIHRGLADSQA
jgi:cyanophycin synthetase